MIIALMLSVAINASAQGQNGEIWFKRGQNALNEGKKEEAFKNFKKAAEMGNLSGLNYLSQCYFYGFGTTENRELAFKYASKPANAGSATSQYILGRCYLEGNGATENVDEAFKWFKKSAEGGHYEAACYLGGLYCSDKIAYKDTEEGIKWLKIAAENENALQESAKQLLAKLENSKNNKPQQQNNQQASTNNTSSTSTTYNTNNWSSHSSYDSECIGFTIGYAHKTWKYVHDNGDVSKCGPFDRRDHVSGIQLGVTIDPSYGVGFGLQTGLYYEFYHGSSDKYVDANGFNDKIKYNEHNLVIPIHAKYSLELSPSITVGAFAGMAADVIVAGKIKWVDTDEHEVFHQTKVVDKDLDQKRANLSMELGVSAKWENIMFSFRSSKGISNNAESGKNYKVRQIKPMTLGITWFF